MADGTVELEILADDSEFAKRLDQLGDHAEGALGKGMDRAAKTVESKSGSIASKVGGMLSAPFQALGDKAASMFPGLAGRFSGLGEKAKAALDGIGSAAGKVFSGLGSLALKAGSAIAAGLGAGLAAIGRFAFDAYGEYEQLQGGAQLMFGDGYDFIADRAANAYKTVQMSQNDYLRQVNGFAVGLRESLGGDSQAAALLADRIVTAEADIVSATGNSAEAVQNAFAGVMKGNYTMLDNLGLGITATKEGMQEVIDKMNEVNGTDYSIDNIADVQNALIDYVAYCETAGYAASEGATTIQGSVASMKGAWENFLAGLADPDADLGALAGNLVGTVTNAAGTIVPAFVRAVAGAVTELPGAIAELAPVLADGITQAIATAMGMDVHEQESAGELAMRIIRVLARRIRDGFPDFLSGAGEMLSGIGTAIVEATPVLLETLISMLLDLISSIPEQIPSILAGAMEFFGAIGTAISNKGPEILSTLATALGELVGLVIGGVAEMVGAGAEFIGGLLTGSEDGSSPLKEWFSNLPQTLSDALGDVLSFFGNIGENIVNGIVNGIKAIGGNIGSTLLGFAEDAFNSVCGWLGIASPSKLFRDKVGKMVALGMAEGIEAEKGAIATALEDSVDIRPDSLARLASMPMPAFAGAAASSGLAGVASAAGSSRAAAAAASSAASADLSGKLDRILSAIEAGKVIKVDGRELGRTVRKAL